MQIVEYISLNRSLLSVYMFVTQQRICFTCIRYRDELQSIVSKCTTQEEDRTVLSLECLQILKLSLQSIIT